MTPQRGMVIGEASLGGATGATRSGLYDMRDDRVDELRALRRVLEVCRAQAVDLDMPALTHILSRAEASLSSYQADPPQVPPARALPVPRQRASRHWRH